MANENIVTNIVATSDFSGLISDLNRVAGSLSKLQAELVGTNRVLANQAQKISANFAATLRSTGQFSSQFVTLNSDVEKFGKQIDAGQLKLRQFFRVYAEHSRTSGGIIRELARQQTQLSNAIVQPLGKNAQGLQQFNVHIPKGLDEIKSKTALARQELQIMNRVVQNGAGQLINWGKNTQWAGRQLTVGLTVPIAAFGKAAADAFRLADQELTRLTKVYGDIAGTSSEELGKVRDDIIKTSKELSSAMGVSFRDTIALAADIAATGQQGNDLIASVQETSRLAILGEVDRQEAMKATLAIQTAFRQNTDELAQSINFLNAVENQTSTSLNDLVEAIPKAGPVIKGLGGSVQDLALYMTALREGGISAGEGANALKSGLASLINPTDVAVEKMQSFGIDILGIVNNNAGNVTATILELQKALDTLNPLQRQQAIEQLFGKFQFSRLNALFNNLGRQGSQTLQVFDLMNASAEQLASVADRELAAVTESASGRYRRALESLKAELATIGEQFLTINTKLLEFITNIVKFVTDLPKPIQKILGVLGMFTAISGPIIMLTGVLGNFFGYIIKGVMHFKALFKGGEGWKLLTPEILAAEKAGSLIEQTFYSDAKAAEVLRRAIGGLSSEYSILEQKARAAAIAVSTGGASVPGVAGATGIGSRQANPAHPLAGSMGTRASTHMVPRTMDQPRTMFGLVPGSVPLNALIGENPQVYMKEPLPEILGVTAAQGTRNIGGSRQSFQVSTGVVSEEAARSHAMLAALGMQSKAEILELKKSIALTGVVNKEFMDTFDDILPQVRVLTDSAATQSAAIVAELQAGKMSIEQARARIIQLNIQTEQMIASTVGTIASNMGRTIDVTKIPTLEQPVVDPTGRSNMRELFKKENSRNFITKLARTLGVRTSGAGYNIETTIPRKFQKGGTAIGTPVEKYRKGIVGAGLTLGRNIAQRLGIISSRATKPSYKIKTVSGTYAKDIPGMSREKANSLLEIDKMPTGPFLQSLLAAGNGMITGGTDAFIGALVSENLISAAQADDLLQQISNNYINKVSSKKFIGDNTNPYWTESNKVIGMNFRDNPEILGLWKQFSSSSPVNTNIERRSSSYKPIRLNLNGRSIVIPRNKFRGTGDTMFLHASNPTNFRKNIAGFQSGVTRVPGYGGGDIIPALIEPGESVVTKEATRGNEAAITMMNAGVPLDSMLPRFQEGETSIGQSFVQGLRNPYGSGMLRGRAGAERRPMGFGAQMGIGIGGAIAGSMIGGPLGTGVMIASNILPMMGMLRGMGGLLPTITKLAGVLGKLTLPTALLSGAFLLGKYLMDVKKRAEEVGQANRMAFGGDNDTILEEAGIKYKTMEERLKEVNDQLEIQRARGLAAYRAVAQSGIPGLTLTIKELQEEIKNAKENSKETVEAFNNIDPSKVNQLAASIKQQFVSAGMSVQDATNKIFAIIKASDKASQALGAITNRAFISIQDKSSAAEFALENLARTLEDKSLFNAEEFAAGVDNLLTALESYRESLIGTEIDGKEVDALEAQRLTLEKISKTKGANRKLDEDTIDNIRKQNLLLGSFLGKAETIVSIYAKATLAQQGFTDGLAGLSANAAVTLAKGMQAYGDAVEEIGTSAEEGSPLKSLNDVYNEVAAAAEKSGKAAVRAAKLTTDSIDKQIKARQKIIDKLEKEKAERLKILELQQQSESFETQVAQAQLRYQEALATGNMAQAAQEQLNIEQLKSDRERDLARNAITDKYDKDIEALRNEIARLQELKDRQQTSVQNTQKTAADLEAERLELESFRARLLDLAKRNPNISGMSKKDRQALAGQVTDILNEMEKAGGASAEAAAAMRKDYRFDQRSINIPRRGTITRMPEIELLNALTQGSMELAGTGEFKDAVEKFGKWVQKLLDEDNKTVKLTAKQISNIAEEYRPRGFNPYNEEGFLKESSRQDIINALGLEEGDVFEDPQGNKYIVKIGKSAWMDPRAVRKANGGYVKQYGPGGAVYGPGTATSDSIPAMLSDGEYVIRAAAVAKYGLGTFDAYNSMSIPGAAGGGLMAKYDIPRMNMGGRVYMNQGGPSGLGAKYDINVTLNGSSLTPEEVARAISREMQIREAMNGRNRNY